jgi:hypothetical protein
VSKFSRRLLAAPAASPPALAVPAVAVTLHQPSLTRSMRAIKRWKEAHAVEVAGFEARNAAEKAFRNQYGSISPSVVPRELAEILERHGHEVPYWSLRTYEQITRLKRDADLGKYVPLFHRQLNIQMRDYEEKVALRFWGIQPRCTSLRALIAHA